MTNPKKITEEQAQELANILGCWIAVDDSREVAWFKFKPVIGDGFWQVQNGSIYCGDLPILILSTLPWTEQIWRPE